MRKRVLICCRCAAHGPCDAAVDRRGSLRGAAAHLQLLAELALCHLHEPQILLDERVVLFFVVALPVVEALLQVVDELLVRHNEFAEGAHGSRAQLTVSSGSESQRISKMRMPRGYEHMHETGDRFFCSSKTYLLHPICILLYTT